MLYLGCVQPFSSDTTQSAKERSICLDRRFAALSRMRAGFQLRHNTNR
jgi:hypothetical protein